MLARSFSVPLVAEGVETREMAEKLQEMAVIWPRILLFPAENV